MNGVNLIIGNVCSLLAMGTDAISAAQKTAKRLLWVQIISQLIYCTGSIILKGYSGAVQNVISTVRNLVAIKNIKSKALEWILVVLGVVLGLVFNNLGWVGLLPVIANLQYTLAVFYFKEDERALKKAFLIVTIMFAIFNLAIYNFVGFCTNIVLCITTAIFLLKKKKPE